MFKKITLIFLFTILIFLWNNVFADYIENSRWVLFEKDTWIALSPEEAAQIRAEEAARLKAWNTASMEPLNQNSSQSSQRYPVVWNSYPELIWWTAEKLSDWTINAYDKNGNLKHTYKPWDEWYNIANEDFESNKTKAAEQDKKNQEELNNSEKCSPWKICSPEFTINTSTFSVGWNSLKSWITAKDTINKTLWTFIQKLMIALWVISLLIMTIWTWYIILYHGEDEYLSKWKSIFTAWIIALVISLSSYYMVNLVWYILYK